MRRSRDCVQSAGASVSMRRLQRAGAGLVEYVLLIALVAVGLVMMLIQFRQQPGRILNDAQGSVGNTGISAYGAAAAVHSGNTDASRSSSDANGATGNGNGNGNNGNGNGNGGGNGSNGNDTR
jgi:Flp pilus assembly pilin Flp